MMVGKGYTDYPDMQALRKLSFAQFEQTPKDRIGKNLQSINSEN
jgi:hypothetical protein